MLPNGFGLMMWRIKCFVSVPRYKSKLNALNFLFARHPPYQQPAVRSSCYSVVKAIFVSVCGKLSMKFSSTCPVRFNAF